MEADKKALELTRARYETGVDDALSVVQAQTTLESVQAQAINVGLARAQFEHAIATLIGKPPSSFSIPVEADDHRAAAHSDRRPLGVTGAASGHRRRRTRHGRGECPDRHRHGSVLSNADSIRGRRLWKAPRSKLFRWSSRVWAIGGTLSQTLFDAGLRRATVNQFIATYNAAVAGYRQTVLTAFQQVEDFLAAVRIQSQQVIKLQQAVNSAETALKLQLGRYETGIDPYLNVVIAQTTLLSNQQTLVTSQVSEMVAAVQLITALGGGWDRSQLPTPEQVTHKPSKADTTIVR